MDVRATNLTMRFHDADRVVEVFRDLSFSVDSGTSVAIVGESGVGKTTLLYLLGALEQPVSGEVVVGGTEVTKMQREGRDVAPFRGESLGFVFQSHHLLPEFDAVENVAMPLLIRGVSQNDALNTAREFLTKVGLSHRFTHRPGALSGGEQQRVAIARALCGRPGVVLADEPTGNLDYRTGQAISDLLLKLRAEEKMTLIIVTHSLELASKMDRVLELTTSGIFERRGETGPLQG